jgi:hypothetical protein
VNGVRSIELTRHLKPSKFKFRYREAILMSVLGPTAEILFFACPKKSIQKKRHPDAAYFLRSSLLNGVAKRGSLPLRQRAASMRRPYGLFRSKAPVLGAAYGAKTISRQNS